MWWYNTGYGNYWNLIIFLGGFVNENINLILINWTRGSLAHFVALNYCEEIMFVVLITIKINSLLTYLENGSSRSTVGNPQFAGQLRPGKSFYPAREIFRRHFFRCSLSSLNKILNAQSNMYVHNLVQYREK